jgi:ABC-type nickel/cobalt efflux system permease component RcnA
MSAAELLQWYNVGYVGVFIMGLMFLVMGLMGLGDQGVEQDFEHDVAADTDLDHDLDVDADHDMDADLDQDVDHDLDHDVDQDVDHDVDQDADQDVDHDADHEVSHDHEAGHNHDVSHPTGPGIFQSLLALLGIGRCPLSIIIMSFCFLFSLIGFGSNLVLKGLLRVPLVFGTVSYGVAFIVGLFLTGSLARLIGKILPTKETYVQKSTDLVGKTGTAVYDFQDGKGFIQIYDAYGTLLERPAISHTPIKKGQKVVVTQWEKQTNRFVVVAVPLDLELPG